MPQASFKILRLLSTIAAVATFLLILLGGIVRVTGSGLACPDWPLCQGQIVPPLDGPILIEWSHRLATTMVSALVVAVAFLAWRSFRYQISILGPAILSLGLLGLQVALGGITVLLELPPTVVTLHLATALGLLATLLVLATNLWSPPGDARPSSVKGERFFGWALALTMAALALILTGSFMVGSGAAAACPDWPLCQEQIFPWGQNNLTDIHLAHRLVATAVGVLILVLVFQAFQLRREFPKESLLSGVVVALFLIQILAGGLVVVSGLEIGLRALHLTLATAIWGGMIILSTLLYGKAKGVVENADRSPLRESSSFWSKAMDIISLAKPRILALLLFTTLVAMILAKPGMPPLSLLLLTMVGGGLAAAGASALNSYLDRDIDGVMFRTRRRPLPLGRLEGRTALAVGIVWSTVSFLILALGVNTASALLAVLGILYYVLIYTAWLKRSTPQNIVIGGAAGAIPPLVGWAAVNNELNLLALYLFAIVFFWTPPHTWALALWLKRDYARAGVPMLPAVAGEGGSIRQIALYSLQLVPISLLPVIPGALGLAYAIGALVLGAGLLYQVQRLWSMPLAREAKALYKYSTVYLALLFLAMVIDRLLLV